MRWSLLAAAALAVGGTAAISAAQGRAPRWRTGSSRPAPTLDFDKAVQRILRWEGGYVDHPEDPGGATNRGITQATLSSWRGRPVSKDEVRALTVGETKAIYRARYWDRVRGDELPAPLAVMAFDTAVLSGPSAAAKALQRAIGANPDGAIGPLTIAAARAADLRQSVGRFYDERLAFLQRLSHWPTFGRGWKRRLDDARDIALEEVGSGFAGFGGLAQSGGGYADAFG